MEIEFIVEIVKNAIWLTLILSLPALSTALIVGVIISLFQAVTQIQEQTLTFVPKIIATLLVLALTSAWGFNKLVIFTTDLFNKIPSLNS